MDDVVVPPAADLYPDNYIYRVTEDKLSREMEGAHRPGHFDGVLTVVLKLLNAVQPQRAYFGEKDWQQLRLVGGMVRALLLPVEIVPCATERDVDGLALSSRNRRLSNPARVRAAQFPLILRSARTAEEAAEFRAGPSALDEVVRRLKEALGLISFYTVGDTEARAWTLRRGETALDAAESIHSDIARGFIRAEVIRWDDLLECGSHADAARRGLQRLEGKTYVVDDGDVINVRFNV